MVSASRLTRRARCGNNLLTGIWLPTGIRVPEATENPNLREDRTPSRVDRRVQEFRSRVLETAETLFAERGVEAAETHILQQYQRMHLLHIFHLFF